MSEQGIIEIDVGLQASTKSEIDEYLGKMNEIKEQLQEVRGEAPGAGAPVESAPDEEKELTEEQEDELQEFLGKVSTKELKQLQGLAKNPTSFIQGHMEQVFKSLGPRSAMMIPIIGAVVASAVLYIEIMKALSVKGGPFNRDWRRFLANEVNVGINRELQKRQELGLIQTVLTQQRGFTPNNAETTYNSLYLVNESRIARIGLDDRAAGVTVG